MKTKNFFLGIIPALLLVTVSCENMNKLSESDVDPFLESFFDSQIGGQATVETYNNTLSNDLVEWSNATWNKAPSAYDKAATDAYFPQEKAFKIK